MRGHERVIADKIKSRESTQLAVVLLTRGSTFGVFKAANDWPAMTGQAFQKMISNIKYSK